MRIICAANVFAKNLPEEVFVKSCFYQVFSKRLDVSVSDSFGMCAEFTNIAARLNQQNIFFLKIKNI